MSVEDSFVCAQVSRQVVMTYREKMRSPRERQAKRDQAIEGARTARLLEHQGGEALPLSRLTGSTPLSPHHQHQQHPSGSVSWPAHGHQGQGGKGMPGGMGGKAYKIGKLQAQLAAAQTANMSFLTSQAHHDRRRTHQLGSTYQPPMLHLPALGSPSLGGSPRGSVGAVPPTVPKRGMGGAVRRSSAAYSMAAPHGPP